MFYQKPYPVRVTKLLPSAIATLLVTMSVVVALLATSGAWANAPTQLLLTPRWSAPLALPPAKAIALKPMKGEATAFTSQAANLLRVGLSDNKLETLSYPSTKIGATTAFTVLDVATQTPLLQGQASDRLYVAATKDNRLTLQLMGQNGQLSQTVAQQAGSVVLKPTQPGGDVVVYSVQRKGTTPRYHGVLEVKANPTTPGTLYVINQLDVDEYLKAVVPNELPIRFGAEAVRAQAVAARNYALFPRENPWEGLFDICDSQYCQAYYGAQTETAETSALLKETEGLFALYAGEPLLALFSSAHGGASEAYHWVFSEALTGQFPAPPLPYLQAGFDVPTLARHHRLLMKESNARAFWSSPKVPSFESESPLYRWQYTWPVATLEAILSKELLALSNDPLTAAFITPAFTSTSQLGKVKRLYVSQRGESGKAAVLTIETTTGQWQLQKEFLIRKALRQPGNPNRFLPSANVVFSHLTEPSKTGNNKALVSIKAQGGGFGHGVGLSQYGASGMGKAGASFAAMLQHYYKGSTLGSLPLRLSATQAQSTHFKVPSSPASPSFKDPTGALHANPRIEPVLHALWPACAQSVFPATGKNTTLVVALNQNRFQVSLGLGQHVQAPLNQTHGLKQASFNKESVNKAGANTLTLEPAPTNVPASCAPPKVWVEVTTKT